MKKIHDRWLTALGKNLRIQREKRGLSQAQLAANCNVERAKISRIENGAANLYITTFLELAIGLSVSPDVFFQGIKFDAEDE